MRGERDSAGRTVGDTEYRSSKTDRNRTTLTLVDEAERETAIWNDRRPNPVAAALDETVLEVAMRYRRALRTTPTQFAVVAQSEPMRSANAGVSVSAGPGTATGDATTELPFSTATIADAADFVTVVEHVDATLEAWNGANATVVLDGIGTALDRSSEEAVFRFLHLLVQVVVARDARLSATLDPSSVDGDTVVFEPLFDAVVDRRDEE